MMTKQWPRRAGVKETPVDGDVFLVLPEGGDIYHLNALGAALWRLLAEPADEAGAADTLAVAFPDLPRGSIDAESGSSSPIFKNALCSNAPSSQA